MEYKILIKLYVPQIEQSFEMYIPVNRTISQVKVLLNNVINDITVGIYPIKDNITLVNRRENTIYEDALVIRDTSIKNGSELVMY
ncbi:MAG: hypothetical protein GX758_02545 [Tenericutes bacterium]|nr:hypothetical protein [Mycoplasmatota bacterium]